MNYLEENGILPDIQHGFHQTHSCEMQLVTFIQECIGPVTPSRQWDIVVMDFTKAFDKSLTNASFSKLHH